jgi:hypothetical protein
LTKNIFLISQKTIFLIENNNNNNNNDDDDDDNSNILELFCGLH